MDKATENPDSSCIAKLPLAKTKKTAKNSKSFISLLTNSSSNFRSKKSSKKLRTPLNTHPNLYKENIITKTSDSSSKLSRPKSSRQSTLKKKPSKTKLKNPRVKSLNSNQKSLKDQKSNSRQSLNTQSSAATLRILDTNKKLTPRSTHPSPQHSHRTPDSIKIAQNLPNLTEEKTKIPEVGYYCKRIALFEKSKELYKEKEEFELKSEFPKLNFDIPFSFAEDALAENEEFNSPKRVIRVYSSPGKTEKGFDRNEEPRAPRKGLCDFDSPGSFLFSLSSSSDESFSNSNVAKRDEESQTELVELIGDGKVVEGLKLIGRISEMLNSKDGFNL